MRAALRSILPVVGVDEAGRGPLAGPVSVAAVYLSLRADLSLFRGIRDSKRLRPGEREEWFRLMRAERDAGRLAFAVSFTGPRRIDRLGIVRAVALALRRALLRLAVSEEIPVLLDGSLAAPARFRIQRTIVRGDESHLPIILASVAAKVARDRRMSRLAKLFPEYEFSLHKGYGTKLHYARLRRFGLSDIHRRSFLKGFDRARRRG